MIERLLRHWRVAEVRASDERQRILGIKENMYGICLKTLNGRRHHGVCRLSDRGQVPAFPCLAMHDAGAPSIQFSSYEIFVDSTERADEYIERYSARRISAAIDNASETGSRFSM